MIRETVSHMFDAIFMPCLDTYNSLKIHVLPLIIIFLVSVSITVLHIIIFLIPIDGETF